MSTLKSDSMNLSQAERRWLPWFGETGKLAMARSCFLNRHNYSAVEKTFEGIAATRVKILQQWAASQWNQMELLAEQLVESYPDMQTSSLQDRLAAAPDFSELFIIDKQGKAWIANSDGFNVGTDNG